METYQQLKKRQHDEFGAFQGVFFSFNNEQFREGLEKIGLRPEDNPKDHIYSLGAGGYILKSASPAFHAMRKRHDQELKELKKNEKELLAALVYQLNNHEYCITLDPTDALEALDLKREEVDPKLLKKAISLTMEAFVC